MTKEDRISTDLSYRSESAGKSDHIILFNYRLYECLGNRKLSFLRKGGSSNQARIDKYEGTCST
uniref:SFRICE_024324 n=1 Tax=Spodoptera frugiperda TaxID=7108 RepID=A0A2H1VWA0_SPOFR